MTGSVSKALDADGGHRQAVDVRIGSRTFPVFFECGTLALSGTADASITAALVPMMAAHVEACRVGGEASARLLGALPRIQDLLFDWHDGLTRCAVTGTVPTVWGPASSRVGTFFSGGVDSFFTLLRHRDEITDLVFVHGFDIDLGDDRLLAKASTAVRRIGDALGKRVIEIRTNLRRFMDAFLDWGRTGHGAGLASVGHQLSGQLGRLYIPASHTYKEFFPWGTHPVLDPLWSSEALEFVHDGNDFSRIEKVRLLADFDIAIENLRVCWRNPGGAYNCGRCEKCLRTQLNLLVAGALDRCPVFEAPLDVDAVRRTRLPDRNTLVLMQENLDALEAQRRESGYQAALRAVLRRTRLRLALKSVVKRLLAHSPAPALLRRGR